jgi:predicted amidohydrolase YtcJ
MCVLAGWGLGFAAVLSALGQASGARNSGTGYSVAPDTIFFHGDILTGTRLKAGDADPTPGRVSAVAMRAGKIVAVGGDAAMLRLKDAHTKTIDLKGAFAMPGFNDAHTHMAPAGRQRLSVDLDNVTSLAVMLEKVQAYSAKLGPGEWILGGGWDHTKWAGAKLPTRQDLDAVSAGHPAFLERTDGHIAIANTAALKAAGITDTTPNPKGGQIDRDADGHATGILREGPTLAMVEKVIPPPSLATRRKAIELSMQDALSHGVTSIQDFSDWEDFLAMEEMEDQGTLHLRIAEWIDFNQPIGVLNERRASHPADDPLLHLTFLKGFMDGSLGSRTAAMNAPYADDPNNYGIARYDQDKLNQMAAARAADGFQLGFHAIGDRANDMALNAFSAAEQIGRPANVPAAPKNADADVVTAVSAAVRPRDFRFRIEHAQVVSPGAFERFAELGVIASMQPSHLLTDMAWAEARLGPERVKRAYAWKSFLDHGVTLAFGTDYPVESISPFRGLYAAITRQNVEGTQTFQPQEKLTIDEAIYAYTQASAFAEFREKIKGRLEPGYLADMVVLDRDITKASPQEVLHTQVLRTVVGGNTVYRVTSGQAAP